MGQCNWFAFADLKLSITRNEELGVFWSFYHVRFVSRYLSLRTRSRGQPSEVFLVFFFLDDKSLVMVSYHGYEILRHTKPFLRENFFQQ